jgi:hypothetical protein
MTCEHAAVRIHRSSQITPQSMGSCACRFGLLVGYFSVLAYLKSRAAQVWVPLRGPALTTDAVLKRDTHRFGMHDS